MYTKDLTERDWVFNLGMMKVYSSLEQYGIGTNYLGWARTILVRSAIDHHRKDKKYYDHLSPIVNEDIDINVSEVNKALDRVETESLVSLIQSLPERERLVFTMYEIDDYSHPEIEEMTGMNRNTSKWLLSKARNILRDKAINFFNLKTSNHAK